MRRLVLILFASWSIAALFISCGPPTQVDISESKRCLPHSLVLDQAANRNALIAWNPGCPGIRIMRGFNIYLSPVPLVEHYSGTDLPGSIVPFNRKIYPGDTLGNPDRESYECKDIENATVYYIHVRAVYNDNSLSAPTNEIEIITYPQGEIELTESYSGERDGFCFAKDDYCPTKDVSNDIYFYHKDGRDYLCSPSRIGPVNRLTKIYPGRQGLSFDDLLALVENTAYVEKTEISQGSVYLVITEDGHPARLEVKKISGNKDNRKAKFEYFFMPPVEKQEPDA